MGLSKGKAWTMKILFDTNIIIDVILEREPFYSDSRNALLKSDGFDIDGYISASTLTDIYYICKKQLGHDATIEIIKNLIDSINILNVSRDTIVLALHCDFSEFEDAVQSASAELNQVDLIISRNTKDFSNSKTLTVTPKEFLEKHNQ